MSRSHQGQVQKILLITDQNVFVIYVDGIPQLKGILAERNFEI